MTGTELPEAPADGALTAREKSLIALAVAHAVQCPYCIDAYTQDAQQKGADIEQMTREADLAPEMKEHIQRWQTVERSLANWFEQVQLLREFATARPQVLRQQLVDYFSLAGTYTLRVEAEQAMGYVRVNSLDLRAGSPGVENPGAWAGVYFLGQELQVSAVPLPGYRFSHWEGLDGQTDPSLSLQPGADLALRAVFAPQD